MRTVRLLAVAVLVLGVTAVAVEASEVTGKVLLAQMNSKKRSDNDSAMGYITGVFGVYKMKPAGEGQEATGSGGYVVDEEEMKTVAKVAKEFLEGHPDRLTEPANKLLTEAFEKAFPKKTRC